VHANLDPPSSHSSTVAVPEGKNSRRRRLRAGKRIGR
jgi:hypothetical protein